MIDMNTALQAELGDVVNQIDNMTYDEQDVSGLIKIKQQQVVLANNMLVRNAYPGDISYLLSFLNKHLQPLCKSYYFCLEIKTVDIVLMY